MNKYNVDDITTTVYDEFFRVLEVLPYKKYRGLVGDIARPMNLYVTVKDEYDLKSVIGKARYPLFEVFDAKIEGVDSEEEEWTPLSKLGRTGIDFDLIPSNEFLDCVKVQGFIDDDGDGYPVIKADDGTFLYNKKKSVYPSEIQNKDKLDFDYIAWFNK